jgi:hypothetical protein
MSRMGNLVVAIEEELQFVMDGDFVVDPDQINMSLFEIASRNLSSQGFYASANDCELVWAQGNEFCEL